MYSGFQVNMIVDDVEPCVSFYKSLGFTETFRFPAEGPGAHVEVRAMGLTLGVSDAAVARTDHALDISGEGNAVQVCLWCDNLDVVYARMLELGAQTAREPRDFLGGRLRNCWVRDPGNNLVQLAQERW